MGRQATDRRPRRAFRLLLVGSLLLAAGCFAAPSPTPSGPAFPGYPSIPHYSGSQCKTVLLIGESQTMSYGELQEEIGRLLHNEKWQTRQIPKTLAKAGALVEDAVAIVGALVVVSPVGR